MPEPADNDPAIGRRGAYPKGVARRAEILDRALDVFRERGASGTSLRSIAEALGVSHAALLHYFDSRDQLLVAVYEHHEQRPADPDAPEPGDDTVTRMVEGATANGEVPGFVELYTTLVAASLDANNTAAREYFTRRFERVRENTAESLRIDQARGIVRTDIDADTLAALFVAAWDGMQVQWMLDPSVPLDATLGAFAKILLPPSTD